MTTILSAIALGVGVLLAGTVPWVGFEDLRGLAGINSVFGRSVPWAVVPMALYLSVYWKYLRGDWGSRAGAVFRRERLRAHPLPLKLWMASLSAGLLGFAALIALLVVTARLVQMPASAPITAFPGVPAITVFVLLTMSSVVAGATEEAAFRGYMQTPVERRFGVVPAICVSGTIFGLLHFPNHPADVLLMLPYYIAVSAVYGGLTWAANSILPALVLHVGGDVWSLNRLWLTGRPEWQLSPFAPTLIRDTGIDVEFVFASAMLIVLAAATIRAYRGVRRLAQRTLNQNGELGTEPEHEPGTENVEG